MTAWSAKVLTSSILSLGERLDPLARQCDDANRLALTQQRHPELCALPNSVASASLIFRVGSGVGDVTDAAL